MYLSLYRDWLYKTLSSFFYMPINYNTKNDDFMYHAMQILDVVRPMKLDCQFLVTPRMLFENFSLYGGVPPHGVVKSP